MSARRILSTMAALAVITSASAAGVARALPLDLSLLRPQAVSPTRMEIRLAETEAGVGLLPATGPGGAAVYLHPETVVTAADVTGATVVEAGGSRFAVAVRFTDSASARMLSATQSHLGRPMAVLLDGQVVAAPMVRSPVGGSAVIGGTFSEDQARRLADGLGAQARVAPRDRVEPVDARAFAVTPPKVTFKVDPRYTPEAMSAKIEGTVVMDVVVEADGSVGEVDITKSLDSIHGLDDEAIAAVKQWEFQPGTAGGKAVPVKVTIEMRFTLK